MRNALHLLLMLWILVASGVACFATAADFTLHSNDLPGPLGRVALDQVYDQDGCHGRNVSPELSWSGEPAGTRSFAVTVFDPDASGGNGWWHWLVYDIASTVNEISRGAGMRGHLRIRDGARQARNDFGDIGYDGPCPPAGSVHRYVVAVYALNVRDLQAASDAPHAVASMIRKHAIAKAVRVVRYGH